MKKSELISELCKKCDLQKVEGEKVIDAIPEIIVKAAKKEGSVKIPHLGTFYLKKREARKGVNPATGEKIDIPAASVITFKIAKDLKEELN